MSDNNDSTIQKDSFDMSIENEWEEGSGETHAIKAKVTLTDPDTGREETYRLRNAVDIGYQVWRENEPDTLHDHLNEDTWLTVQGTVIDTWTSDQNSIKQKGIIEADARGDDETKKIEYVIWDSTSLDPLTEDTEYRLTSVVTNKYDDELYLSLNKNTTVTPVSEIDVEAEECFDTRARKYLKRYGPVPTGMRMTENDGRSSGFGNGAPRRPQGRGGYQ